MACRLHSSQGWSVAIFCTLYSSRRVSGRVSAEHRLGVVSHVVAQRLYLGLTKGDCGDLARVSRDEFRNLFLNLQHLECS